MSVFLCRFANTFGFLYLEMLPLDITNNDSMTGITDSFLSGSLEMKQGKNSNQDHRRELESVTSHYKVNAILGHGVTLSHPHWCRIKFVNLHMCHVFIIHVDNNLSSSH